jgi:hypothetical protein
MAIGISTIKVTCQTPDAQTTFKSPHSVEADVVFAKSEAAKTLGAK